MHRTCSITSVCCPPPLLGAVSFGINSFPVVLDVHTPVVLLKMLFLYLMGVGNSLV